MYNTHSDIWIAGAFAAVVVDFVVYPFDTLKTRIQSPNYEKVFKDARTGAIRRDVLFRGLYQGVWSVVFSTIPSSGAFFTTYEAVKSTLHDSSTRKISPENSNYFTQGSNASIKLPFTHSLPTPIIHAIASSTAEMVSCLMLTPAEVLKQNAQMVQSSQESHKRSNVTAMRQVLSRFKARPWRLWSGYTALVGRNLPFTGLQFPLFEYVRINVISWRRQRKERHAKRGESKSYSETMDQLAERAGLTGLSASVAGLVSSTVTTPIDVIKTRVMLSATEECGPPFDKGKVETRAGVLTGKKGTFEASREIWRMEGVRGLFKGGAIRAGWTALAMSLYLSLYEGGRFYLENRRKALDGV
ncbi:Mitochondrial substrate/solute carrier [Penicillium argentinense]|uniref:Mitochondrial substrate/solute carrier n=1 Tax=Penicillium argentinense TaxID=1131581 RepID=A0A9W9KAF6_9EURO|nr:Mitochondrial substrate/solute carrier [Penicillium argentinense]KAJ5098970.1 Mitochondrial substrate/solute carrier [Penicillium argentinense]